MRADVVAIASLFFGAIIVMLLVQNYKGVAAETTAGFGGAANLTRAFAGAHAGS